MVEREKWRDPRTPVSVEMIGRYKVTIFDLEAYDQSKLLYPDDPDSGDVDNFQTSSNRSKPFAKKKPASRWNWIVKPKQPLRGRTA
ncbi:MAG TPA: hypothetical protein VHV10_06560 [Ktedonobacteraceae bacterium]|nr:hypothetical protein [Ktedonobacteraceae bacterium]